MTPAAGPLPGAGPPADDLATSGFGGEEPFGDLGSLLGQWATAIGPMFFGLQVGSVVGHLSHRALGQYPLAIPWAPSDELLLVTPNVTQFAADWSLPEEEALVWVCARELASNSVLTRPAVRHRLQELLAALAASSASAQQDLAGRLGGLGLPDGSEGTGMDLESLQGMFGDPEALLGELLTPESRRSSEPAHRPGRGHRRLCRSRGRPGGHQAGRLPRAAGGGLVPAPYRAGQGRGGSRCTVGLDLEQAQVDRGRAFIAGVIERAGEDGLATVVGRRQSANPFRGGRPRAVARTDLPPSARGPRPHLTERAG